MSDADWSDMFWHVFGHEYTRLTDDERRLLRLDFLRQEIAADEYARRIGTSNLWRYVEALKVR